MNENERTPAENAADYAVQFADGFFVPCPCCGKEVESPDKGFTSEKEAIHPTQKPVDLLERAIRTHTKPGAVVCDFFAGSGSTGVAAIKAGRRYILIEQSASYYEKGLAWLEETKSALCT